LILQTKKEGMFMFLRHLFDQTNAEREPQAPQTAPINAENPQNTDGLFIDVNQTAFERQISQALGMNYHYTPITGGK
jgi:hypothetical protein